MAPQSRYPIVFFDGLCGLCDRLVRWVMRRDRDAVFHFAPLQGETARRMLGETTYVRDQLSAPPQSMVLQENGQLFFKSEAMLQLLGHLPAPYCAARWLRLFPRWLRDAVYDFVAARRRRWFGSLPTCRLPSAEEAARFLPLVFILLLGLQPAAAEEPTPTTSFAPLEADVAVDYRPLSIERPSH